MRLRAPVVLLTVLLVSSLGAAIGPATAAEPDPMAGAPLVGDCFDVTIKQGYDDNLTEAPVACSADHTLLTTAVLGVPAGVDMTDPDAVNEVIDCKPATAQLVGKDPLLRALTLYSTFVFGPTRAQLDAGARWISCHVAVWDTKGLNDLPSGPLPKARKNPADVVARCVTRSNSDVTCAEKHAYRVDTALFIRASGSDKAVAKITSAKGGPACDRWVRGDFVFRGWRYDDRRALVVCARRTTR